MSCTRLSPDALSFVNTVGNWVQPLCDNVETEWISHLLMTIEIPLNPVHSHLRPYPQEYVVRLIFEPKIAKWLVPHMEEWEAWLEKNLTGNYHMLVTNEGDRQKCVEVSFEVERDAALFKLFFA